MTRKPSVELSAIAGVALPKISAGFLQLFTNLLLARALGPDAFGPLSVCVTSIILLDGIFGAAIDLCVVKLTTAGEGPTSRHGLAIQKAGLILKLLLVTMVVVPVGLLSRPLGEAVFHAPTSLMLMTIAAAAALM